VQTLDKSIMLDIKYHGYERPTPIQCQAMPLALSGRDILGCAETGSGKTAAFSIPMIHHCLRQPPIRRGDGPLALVMAPTRELAQQIEKEVKAFSRTARGFKTAIVVGGANMGDQVRSTARHCACCSSRSHLPHRPALRPSQRRGDSGGNPRPLHRPLAER